MTREEMKIRREMKQIVEKQYLKPVSKRHGYKFVSGFPYIVHDGWLYILYVTTLLREIHMQIEVKPVVLDEVFWTVFDMKTEAEAKPFSFHVTAAFAPYTLYLEEWTLPLETAEQAEAVVDRALTQADAKIGTYCKQIQTLQQFREMTLSREHANLLNGMLCDIALEDYASALQAAEAETALHHSGGFSDLRHGDIYEYVKRYCKEQLHTTV